jgi:hypothetical protein
MHHTIRRTTVSILLVAALSLAATACGGGGDDADDAVDTTTTEETTTTTAAPPPVAPLTGLPIDPALAGRPALVVKMDNVEPKARRQAGLNQADVVYEERVEGSVTRLLAVFHSTDAAPVGPVRSARTSDIGLVSPLNRPFFAWSGANATFAQRIRAANVTDVGVDRAREQYQRASDRPAPSNLMLKSTAEIRGLPADGSGPPPALFTYRAEGEAPAGLEPTTAVGVSYGTSAGSAPVEYRWNGSGWARTQKGTPHVDADGAQVAPANVIIQFVPYAGSDVVDQFGTPIPEAQLLGEGDAWILTMGGLIPGRWHKPNLDSVTTYTDAAGAPVKLTPGRTWVALPMAGGATRL